MESKQSGTPLHVGVMADGQWPKLVRIADIRTK
jgi:hypothetical protein